MPRRFVLGALLAAAAAALLATPAWAAPVPGCAGTAFTDAAGDAAAPTALVRQDAQPHPHHPPGRLASPAGHGPDEGGGNDYAVGGCTGTPTTTPAPDVGGPPPVATTPAGQAPASGTSGPAARPAALHLTVRRTSARTVSRRHALTVAVSTTAPLTQVQALLLDRRGKKVASGALARLSGRRTLKLRVRRTLRKG